ncbi:alpha-mannosidase [Antrihabitans sp. YC3-6]|uniref:Alpha-mannosidase n=1 Tax=Antrihabitans stalagmiti TaxID=2799499 RepID=A0A934NTH9_9NOCA|nr:glycoside hydrolase family 38 C-terminal domain-containing protein [Antrihabitans stalagmiti]MBJ8340895.1 alpha-mannosidase [Antrihabitans stalagmiti]
MHDNRQLVEGRLARFNDERVTPAVYQAFAPVTITAWTVPDEPVPFADAVRQKYSPIDIGTAWGKPWGTMWIHATGSIPEEWLDARGRLPRGLATELLVDPGFTGGPGFNAEGLVFRPDGSTVKAISPYNAYVPVDHRQPLDVYIEAAANPDIGISGFRPTALGDKATAGDGPIYKLARVQFALRNTVVWELQQDIAVLGGLMHALPVDLPRRHEILRAFERMLDIVDPEDVAGTAAAGRAALAEAFAKPAYASAHNLIAVGHAHIDSAWLWPIRETIRKCARTFSNMVDLMDRYPDFTFACSSAQQFAWIKEHYPELFTRIKAKVRAGQFIPVGSMWVEADTNMPGGEAMARQFVAGKRFFLDEFGLDTLEAWLPDSFGYSAALPQIVKSAGADYFLTQKISWNQTNRMPHHTFAWEGIDGTRVFTHFPPVDKYNSELHANDLAHAQSNYREQGVGTVSLIPFGYGDGGGGATREMLAVTERVRSLEGSPTMELGTPIDFFRRAEAEYPTPPVWSGELYLEIHRGTYTTQANTKQGNRRSEHLLREAELWAATASVRAGVEYPYAELEEIWHLVLLQQFHDILPGSSIAWVHHDAERNYAAIAGRLEKVIAAALATLSGIGGGKGTGRGRKALTFNAGPYERDGVASLGAGIAEPADAVVPQKYRRGYVLDNGVLRAVISAKGLITSLTDYATGREAIAPGTVGNLLQLHRDIPNQWDAWDIDEFYRRNVTDLTTVENLSVDGDEVVVERVFGKSRITQRLRLGAGSAALEIVNDIDWQESQKLLKLAFPVDVHADRSASETQFGHVFRPTHSNTSWDVAKFEICAHRWVHVGEPGYGVAVANDSTYGHDIGRRTRDDGGTTTTIRLSLLRAPHYPDPTADLGHHVLRVSISPGATIADAVAEGYRMNLRPRTVRGTESSVEPLVRVSNPAVVVEAVKLAEDRSGDVIVRLYESRGGRADTTLTAGFDYSAFECTDLLERTTDGPATEGAEGAITLRLRPFQLVTLRFGT